MRWHGAAATLLVLALAGCTFGARPGTPTEENSVSQQVDETHRFDVDLSGPMPTRDQLALSSGDTMKSFRATAAKPIAVTYTLSNGRSLEVPASGITVSTTALAVTSPSDPSVGRDDALLQPNEVAATQDFADRDEARDLLMANADVLGLDTDVIDLWYATAPPEPGPNVVLDKYYFSGKARIGYVDVSVGVFISDTAYLIWDLSWDPPIPGYVYGTDGVPRPTSS